MKISKLIMCSILCMTLLIVSGCGSNNDKGKTPKEEKRGQKYKLWATNEDLGMTEMPDRAELDKMGMDYALLVETFYNGEKFGDEIRKSNYQLIYENKKIGDTVTGDGISSTKIVGWVIVASKNEKDENGWIKLSCQTEKQLKDELWTIVPLARTPEELDAELNK